MAALLARSLSFAFAGERELFSSLTFHLSEGFVGLVGENGAGKSTLLRLIAGELSPASGSLVLDPNDADVALCDQEVDRLDEAIRSFAGNESKLARRLRGKLRLDPLELDRFASLSPGERKRWQIGAALAGEPDILLLDEPTNHLDEAARDLLLGALRSRRGLCVIVSHDRAFLDAITDHTLRLHRGTATLYPGSYEAARATWEATERSHAEAHAKRKRDADAVKRALEEKQRNLSSAQKNLSSGTRMKNARDHDARGGLTKGRAQSAERSLGRQAAVVRDKLARAEAIVADASHEKNLGRSLFVGFAPHSRERLLTLDRDELRAGETVVLRDLHLVVSSRDRIWLRGPNGAGKSTLFRALSEVCPALRTLPQELSRDETSALLRETRALPPTARGRVLSLVAALGVDPDRLLHTARPSPGEARKLLFAHALGTHASALALDEPTNHLDLPSIERLEEALAAFPGALLLVTHDEPLARATTDTTWLLEGGHVVM